MKGKATESLQTPSPKVGKDEPTSDPLQKVRRGRKPNAKRAAEAEKKEHEQEEPMPSDAKANPKENEQVKAMPSADVEAKPSEESEPKKRKTKPGPKPKAKAEGKAKAKAKARTSKPPMTEEQKAGEALRRQQTADQNAQLIRMHADSLPDLQPPVGFTNKCHV
eukprot:s62_g37.t1